MGAQVADSKGFGVLDSSAENERAVYVATQWQLMRWRFKKHKMAVVALVLLICLYVLAVFCEFFAPYDPIKFDNKLAFMPPQRIRFIDESGDPIDPSIPPEKVHKFTDLPDLIREQVIDEVITACPRSLFASLSPVIATCTEVGLPITLLSDIFGDYLPPPKVTRFDTMAALNFSPVDHSRTKLAVKRLIDIVGASAILVLAAPILAVAAVAIRKTSPGPVFFRQNRCGLNGRPFEMLKLRTMVLDAEQQQTALLDLNEMDGPVFKIKADPRVTKIGGILRRWSIDELPQIWNVLRGDMSLVGPRPPIPLEVARYETFERRRLSMRPGVTCLWQVSGRNQIGFADWVKLDVEYIDTWSLGQDLKLLLLTVPAALRRAAG